MHIYTFLMLCIYINIYKIHEFKMKPNTMKIITLGHYITQIILLSLTCLYYNYKSRK